MSFFLKGGKVKFFNCAAPADELSSCYRFNDKKTLATSAALFDSYWNNLINLYGWLIDYRTYKYEKKKADNFYGEDPNAAFDDPLEMKILLTLDESNVMIQRFGYNGDDTINAYISIKQFSAQVKGREYYKSHPTEPKAGDTFELTEYGSDRPGERGAKRFIITRVLDSNISEAINQFGYHYVWQIKAKRHDFSFEPNLLPEKGNHQVYEEDLNINNINLPDFGQKFTNTSPTVLSGVAKTDTFSPNEEGTKKRISYGGEDELYGGY